MKIGASEEKEVKIEPEIKSEKVEPLEKVEVELTTKPESKPAKKERKSGPSNAEKKKDNF